MGEREGEKKTERQRDGGAGGGGGGRERERERERESWITFCRAEHNARTLCMLKWSGASPYRALHCILAISIWHCARLCGEQH